MLHILLLVLKIIGIIITAILEYLYCYFVLFFCPFFGMKSKADRKEMPIIKDEDKVTWLLHLFRADVYYKDQKLIWRIRFALLKRMAGKKRHSE